MAAPAQSQQRIAWLFGPWPDLLFGCGLLYALTFGLFLVSGSEIRSAQPSLIFPLLIFGISMPHYGATLLRVYERRRDRRAYALFSVWATLGLAALFVATVFLVFTLFHAVPADEPGASTLLFMIASSQMLFVACCTATLMFHITRMTKAVLRAVELTRKG